MKGTYWLLNTAFETGVTFTHFGPISFYAVRVCVCGGGGAMHAYLH
jgi:hypothetical protein